MKPKTWKDLTVNQFQYLWGVFNDPTFEDIDKQVKLLSICLHKSEDEILDMPLAKVKELSKQFAFIGNMPKEGICKDFWAGRYKWKVQKDITKISSSDYINISEYTKTTDKVIENLPNILYIFCKPKYFIKKPNKDKCIKKLGEASIGDVYPLAVFFCHLIIHLTSDTKDFLEKEMTKIVKNNREN